MSFERESEIVLSRDVSHSRFESVALLPGAMPVASVVEALRHRAVHQTADLCHAFIRDGDGLIDNLSYGDMDREAANLAHALAQRVAPGGRVVLVLQPKAVQRYEMASRANRLSSPPSAAR
jgi:hypothetical protein